MTKKVVRIFGVWNEKIEGISIIFFKWLKTKKRSSEICRKWKICWERKFFKCLEVWNCSVLCSCKLSLKHALDSTNAPMRHHVPPVYHATELNYTCQKVNLFSRSIVLPLNKRAHLGGFYGFNAPNECIIVTERRPSAVCSRVGVGSTLSLRLEPSESLPCLIPS